MNKYIERQFIDNISKRIPVCIVVDCSGSMKEYDGTNKRRIDRVNNGIMQFYEQTKGNKKTSKAVEVEIIQVGNKPKIISNFSSTDSLPSKLEPLNEKCDLAEGINYALKELNKRKKLYIANETNYWQPWIIILSDGDANGGENPGTRFLEVQEKVRELESNDKLVVFPVFIHGVPKQNDNGTYSPCKPEKYNARQKRMRDLSCDGNRLISFDLEDPECFSKFFSFLHKSASSVSNNRGMIYDKQYGSFKNVENDNEIKNIDNIYENVIENIEEDNIKEKDSSEYVVKSIKNDFQQDFKKLLDKFQNEEKISSSLINKKNQKINEYEMYINGQKSYPIKHQMAGSIIFTINLSGLSEIVIIENNNTLFIEKIEDSGIYSLKINSNKKVYIEKKDNISINIINNNDIEHIKNEIKVAIKKINEWDKI